MPELCAGRADAPQRGLLPGVHFVPVLQTCVYTSVNRDTASVRIGQQGSRHSRVRVIHAEARRCIVRIAVNRGRNGVALNQYAFITVIFYPGRSEAYRPGTLTAAGQSVQGQGAEMLRNPAGCVPGTGNPISFSVYCAEHLIG